MEYKSPYLTNDVCLNFIMLALHDLFNTPLYENPEIIIHPHWLDMFTSSMQIITNVSCDVDDDESCDRNNEDRFEEKQEDILINTMMQNILSSKQIYDYFENVVNVALSQNFQTIRPFSKSSI
jgi:hypothetical protein